MPTTGERKALWFFALVALSGSAVRLWRSSIPAPPPIQSRALEGQLRRVDSARGARTRGGRAVVRRPTPDTSAPSSVDLDRATAAEIETLPGIGPALAVRIVANRDSAGPFGSSEALCDVRGIGSVLAARLRPLVTFSGAPRLLSAGCAAGSKSSRKGRGTGHRENR